MSAILPALAAILGETLPTVEVVDVGASLLGAAERWAPLVETGAARITGFEPNPAERARLLAAQRPGLRILPQALGRGGKATLHVTHYPGCSSLYPPDPQVIDRFVGAWAQPEGNFHVVATLPVETSRLDDLVAAGTCPAPDYLKLDVQGGERDVLEGATRTLAGACVVECEVEFVPLYKGQPLFHDVAALLQAQGFLLHQLRDVAGQALRPFLLARSKLEPLSQLLWADAVFVRDFTTAPAWPDAMLLKAALVLHDAYASADLAFQLLAEHDRRGGGDRARRYGAGLAGRELQSLMVTVAQC